MMHRPTARLAVSADGGLVAMTEATRIVVSELPACEAVCEIVIAPESDVAWLGARVLVLTRHSRHTAAQLVDPHGPRTLAEIQLEPALHLAATVGAYALVLGAPGAVVLSASDVQLTPYPFPARTKPTVAGAAAQQFVVAIPGAVEEWDPAGRVPRRRWRLPRPGTTTALGGSDRILWVTSRQVPARIDALPLVNRGQPKAHELPEPIVAIAGHPTTDLLACVGASGRAYAIDLDGRARQRPLAFPGLDRIDAIAVVAGRVTGIVAAQRERPPALLSLEAPDAPADEPVAAPAKHLAARFAAARDRREVAMLDTDPVDGDAPRPAEGVALIQRYDASGALEPRGSWRDGCVVWARTVLATGGDGAPVPPAAPLDDIAARFALARDVAPALALLYGAHLAGNDGVAPIDIARVLDRCWSEALGRGALASTGIARYDGSRIRLATPIQRVLDELPPETGTLVGVPGTPALRGAHAIVEHGDALDIAQRWLARAGGAILVGRDREAAEVCFEARARGAVALLPASTYRGDATSPAIYVAEHAADVPRGLPQLAPL